MDVEVKARYSMERSSQQNRHPSSPGVCGNNHVGWTFSSTWEFIRASASSALSYEVTCKPSYCKMPDSITS